MLKKILSLYKNSVQFSEIPKQEPLQYHVFFDEATDDCIGIPKTEISNQELRVLKALYQVIEYQPAIENTTLGKWREFLLFDGPLPGNPSDHEYRLIQFHINGNDISQPEIEDALKGFFTEETMIIWKNTTNGIVIEGKKQISLTEGELIAMSETLETDFYVKISFFVGKLYPFSTLLPSIFNQERKFFTFAVRNLSNQSRLFTYERVFPAYLATHLPQELTSQLPNEIFELFAGDQELHTTIKVFLENNLNASMTAKKLYIHRNTLQYRLDKFTEKTGIGLKDFYGAFTVFLACQMFEQSQQ
jgi:hypothetical protein